MRYIELTFVVICVVAVLHALGRRWPVPMPLLQVAAGAALSSFAFLDSLDEQSSLLFVMLVPPLLYREAWLVPKRDLCRAIGPVLGLAIGLVALTIAVIGSGVHALFPAVPVAATFALGAALAPTDTVAVGAIVDKMGLPKRQSIILSGESLFNDAVALVTFQVAVSVVTTHAFSLVDVAQSLVGLSVGGIVTGVSVAGISMLVRSALADGDPEQAHGDTLLSLLTPYAAYLAADKLEVSGVLAVVAAGLCAGLAQPARRPAAKAREADAVWTTVCLALNGSVFVMLGLEIRQVLGRLPSSTVPALLGYVALLTLGLVLVRMAWLAVGEWVSSGWQRRREGQAEAPGQASFGALLVTSLCGVRGALTLTATLSIPPLIADGRPFPGRDLAMFLSAGTIVATLLLYGLVSFFLTGRARRRAGTLTMRRIANASTGRRAG